MPRVDEEGHLLPDGPITEASVRENIEVLLQSLQASPGDCQVYRSVVVALGGYANTEYERIAGGYLPQADAMHRENMGEFPEHHPDCPIPPLI